MKEQFSLYLPYREGVEGLGRSGANTTLPSLYSSEIDNLNGNHPHAFLGDVDEGKVMMNIQDGS